MIGIHALRGLAAFDSNGLILGPLTGINEVWLLGASIDDGIISEGAVTEKFANAMSGYALREHGLNLKFTDRAIGTQTQDQIYNRWLTEKSQITGRKDVIVITMPLGNTISDNRPYANQTPEFLESVRAQFVALMKSITDNGNIAMPVNTTFRNYDNNTLHAEQLGSLPYNENILIPSIQRLDPTMVQDKRPYVDPYNVMRNIWPDGYGDVVHPNYQGYSILRNYWIDCICNRIKGLPTPVINRIESPDITPQPRVPSEFTFYGSTGASSTGELSASWKFAYTTLSTDVYMPVGKGYALNSLNVTFPSTLYGTNTNLGTGDKSDSLLNDLVRVIAFYTNSTNWSRAFLIKGFRPNQNFRLEMVAARSANTADRIGQYSVDGGVTFVEQSGAVPPGTVPTIFSITGKANASGEVEVTWRCKTGSTFAYLNGVKVIPL